MELEKQFKYRLLKDAFLTTLMSAADTTDDAADSPNDVYQSQVSRCKFVST
jgi:hypothetical protein